MRVAAFSFASVFSGVLSEIFCLSGPSKNTRRFSLKMFLEVFLKFILFLFLNLIIISNSLKNVNSLGG